MNRPIAILATAMLPAILAAEPDPPLRVDLPDDSTARLQREARALATLEKIKPMPHSNIGILYGDLKNDRRATGTLTGPPPPWALQRLESIAARLRPRPPITATTNAAPVSPAATITNRP